MALGERPAAAAPKAVDDDAVGNEIRSEFGPCAWVPGWVMEQGLTGAQLAVYVALRLFSDRSGASCYPSTKTVSQRAGVAVGTVHNAVAVLRRKGLISTTVRQRPDGSTAGLSYLLFDSPPQVRGWVDNGVSD